MAAARSSRKNKSAGSSGKKVSMHTGRIVVRRDDRVARMMDDPDKYFREARERTTKQIIAELQWDSRRVG